MAFRSGSSVSNRRGHALAKALIDGMMPMFSRVDQIVIPTNGAVVRHLTSDTVPVHRMSGSKQAVIAATVITSRCKRSTASSMIASWRSVMVSSLSSP